MIFNKYIALNSLHSYPKGLHVDRPSKRLQYCLNTSLFLARSPTKPNYTTDLLFLRKKHSNNLANTLCDTKRWKKVPSGKKDKITYSRTCLVGRSVLFSWPLTRKRWLSPSDVCPLPYLGNCRDYFNLMFWTAQGKRSQVIHRYRETDKARKCREFLSSLHSSVKQLKAQNNVRNGFTASSLCSIMDT